MPLHTDFRPTSFDEVVGNETTVKALRAALGRKDCNRSMLFTGPAGCGKTTLAYVVACELGAASSAFPSESDFHDLNSADFRGVDMVREIRRASQFAPKGEHRVWLLDECHKLSPDAQAALLKLLECPPARTWFILATTDPARLIVTIRRRCAQYKVSPLTEGQLSRLLKSVCRAAGVRIPTQIRKQIAQDAAGSAGMALSVADSIVGLSPEEMSEAAAKAAQKQDLVIELCRALAKGAKWKAVAELLLEMKDEDAESVRRVIQDYFRKVLLGAKSDQDQSHAYLILAAFTTAFYDSGHAGLAVACYEALGQAD